MCLPIVSFDKLAACAATASSSALIESQQFRRVAAEDGRFVRIGNLQGVNAREHLGDAADLVRVVAAGEDVRGAGELDGQPQRARIEVDRVVVELPEIRAGRLVN